MRHFLFLIRFIINNRRPFEDNFEFSIFNFKRFAVSGNRDDLSERKGNADIRAGNRAPANDGEYFKFLLGIDTELNLEEERKWRLRCHS